MPGPLLKWLETAPLYVIGAVLLGFMLIAFIVCFRSRLYFAPPIEADGSRRNRDYDGYIVSAALGLLALLLGFTFSLTINRYEERRQLVVAEANAIGTAYLRVQLLSAPHRDRLSGLLATYVDTQIALAGTNYAAGSPLLKKDDMLLTDIWAATAAAFDAVKQTPFSNALVESMNRMIDLDASRRAARGTQIPIEVFVVLLVYVVGTSGILGYVIAGGRDRVVAVFLLALFSLSLMLILDLDRPISGGIRESQEPMEDLRASLQSRPPATFDQWRGDPIRH